MARVALAAVIVAASARAAEEGDAGSRKTLFVVRTTSAKGDRALEDLFRTALDANGRLRVVPKQSAASLTARFTFAHHDGGTEIDLELLAKGGAQLVDLHRFVSAGESLVDAAVKMAGQVAAAANGELPPAPGPVVTEVPGWAATPDDAPAAASAKPGESDAARDWRSPFDRHRKRLDFLLGIDLGGGPWSADPSKIVSGSDSGFDFTNYAPAFTRTIDGRWHPSLALHAGWMFLGAGAFELTWNASRWAGSGSATLIGFRLAGYPFAGLWRERWFDLGIELGGGYALLAGSGYDMTGGYFNFGLTGELPINHWLGAMVYYRLFTPFLKHFYVDYQSGLSEPTSGVSYAWNTFGVGLCFHPALNF